MQTTYPSFMFVPVALSYLDYICLPLQGKGREKRPIDSISDRTISAKNNDDTVWYNFAAKLCSEQLDGNQPTLPNLTPIIVVNCKKNSSSFSFFGWRKRVGGPRCAIRSGGSPS